MADKTNAMDDALIVQMTDNYWTEATKARDKRKHLSEANRAAYDNEQDFSAKIDGMSKEFLPETFQTVEQMAAFIKKGLTQFGSWFSITMGESSPLAPKTIEKILMCYLENMPLHNKTIDFPTVLSDGTKVGLLESVMIFKTHGSKIKQKVFIEHDGELETSELEPWRLQIDLLRNEDFGIDPSGRGMYEIHRVTRDLHHIQSLAEQGVYDKDVVNKIQNDFAEQEGDNRNKDSEPTTFRKRVELKECWGTILNPDGSIHKENVLWTVANQKYLIRKPEKNPFWHGESPFDMIPIIRVPFSVWHKALYDAVVPLNKALNELFNLMLDGGLASVWGIKQIRLDYLEDPTQVSGGIAQGETLAVRADMPDGQKVLEQVTEGQISSDALQMFGIVKQQLQEAALTNQIRQGQSPDRDVSATEIIESSQNADALLASIITEIERGLTRIVKKSWLNILQNADDLSSADLDTIPRSELLKFAKMTPAQRFKTMGNGCTMKVNGLSETLTQAKDFQRIMALLQVASTNPLLMRTFMEKFSPEKFLKTAAKLLNINPDDYMRNEEEQGKIGQDMAFLQQFGAGGNPVKPTGESGQTSEINQNISGSNSL